MYVCMHVCMYVCMYVCIYIMCVYTYNSLSLSLSIYLYVSLSLSIHIHIYAYMYVCVCVYIYIYIHIYIYIYIYTCICRINDALRPPKARATRAPRPGSCGNPVSEKGEVLLRGVAVVFALTGIAWGCNFSNTKHSQYFLCRGEGEHKGKDTYLRRRGKCS